MSPHALMPAKSKCQPNLRFFVASDNLLAASFSKHVTNKVWSSSPARIVKHADDHYTVTYRAGTDGPEQTLDVGLVMMATGRKPRTKGLNLEVGALTAD